MTETVKAYTEISNAVEALHKTGALAVSEEEQKLLRGFRALNPVNQLIALARVQGMIEGQQFITLASKGA